MIAVWVLAGACCALAFAAGWWLRGQLDFQVRALGGHIWFDRAEDDESTWPPAALVAPPQNVRPHPGPYDWEIDL